MRRQQRQGLLGHAGRRQGDRHAGAQRSRQDYPPLPHRGREVYLVALGDFPHQFVNGHGSRELLRDFLEAMALQADTMVETVTGIPASALTAIRTAQNTSAKNWVLSMHPNTDEKLLDHWVNVASFNIRLADLELLEFE